MRIVILKFGGTSLKGVGRLEKAYQHIKRALDEGTHVVCVVSAIGRSGDAYSTDSLKGLIKNHVTKEDQDRILSVRETISSVVFADFLIGKGMNARSLSTRESGIITDENHTNANIIDYDDSRIKAHLMNYHVLVVPGFQGMTRDGVTTTLGRGGSDTTAIYLGI